MQPSQRSDVKIKYDGLYGLLAGLLPYFTEMVPGGPAEKFHGVKALLQAAWGVNLELSAAHGGRFYKKPKEWFALCEAFNQRPASWRESGEQKSDTIGASVAATAGVVVRMSKKYCPADCDMVMDLGCGWGHRLVDFWLAGGPKAALYYGAERAPEGLKALEQIRSLFPEMRCRGVPFDFLQPDFSAVAETPRSLFVYSVHAIEQVQYLGSGVFDALIARFPSSRITGLHLEPVGFQTEPDAAKWQTDRLYAERKRYNQDLYPVLRDHPSLQLSAVETGLLDDGEGNSTSALVWTYDGLRREGNPATGAS